jgi:Lon protease-like protein
MKAGNSVYGSADDLPAVIPVFPLAAALLLPGADMPLNIFEPRYLAMIDWAIARERVIGMIQPGDEKASPCSGGRGLCAIGCAGRITSLAETGDNRYLITLTGIARFKVMEEIAAGTPFRQCRVSARPFAGDFIARAGEEAVDRAAVLAAFRAYLDAHNLQADWETVEHTPNETLINALAMMAPFGPAEKQALLEAPDLKSRAETLVAITEMTLAREPGGGSGRSLQ